MSRPILPTSIGRVSAPIPDGWDAVKGIFVGGCVERGPGSSFRRSAHAHNSTKDPWFGWICVRSAKRLTTPGGKPSRTLFHEYAHILCPNHGHDAKWRETITKLGYPSEAKQAQAYYGRSAKTPAGPILTGAWRIASVWADCPKCDTYCDHAQVHELPRVFTCQACGARFRVDVPKP